MDARRTVGQNGETFAARWLARRGWQILDRNVRYREGELDLIASKDGILAFIEVKTRRSRKHGSPAEAVTPAKQARIRRLAMRYLNDKTARAAAIRFDVIECDLSDRGYKVRHLEDAF